MDDKQSSSSSNVVDGEVVEETPTELTETDSEVSSETPIKGEGGENGGSIIINMESMIKNYLATNDKLSVEAKKLKEMLDDIMNADPTYRQHTEEAKEAAKKKGQTKAEILKRPQAKELDDKLKTLKSEIKENQGALSDYLQEYQRLSGVDEIEGEDGQVRQIVYTARLVKKSFQL
jgi:predicted RNase H-like nuclease (RuvC/YqgF family)